MMSAMVRDGQERRAGEARSQLDLLTTAVNMVNGQSCVEAHVVEGGAGYRCNALIHRPQQQQLAVRHSFLQLAQLREPDQTVAVTADSIASHCTHIRTLAHHSLCRQEGALLRACSAVQCFPSRGCRTLPSHFPSKGRRC
jgi:hypothetical protein